MARLVKAVKRTDDELDVLLDARRIAALAAEHHAFDICAYNMRGLTLIADSFILLSVSSEPQLKAVYNAIRTGMREAGVKHIRVEGTPKGGWLVLDYGSIIVHLFREEPRAFYDLDSLWGDAPLLDLDLEN